MIKLFDKDMNELKLNIDNYQLKIFPLDNFSAYGLIMDGLYFQTSEHAFQYLKFVDINIKIANKIKDAYSPNDAKRIARENRNLRIDNWQDIKYKKMEQVLKLKLNQNPIVKESLLNTKDYLIAECCVDEDTDWGVDNNNKGDNNLGKIWMKIREELKK